MMIGRIGLAALAIGCGSSSRAPRPAAPAVVVPERAATAGDELLRFLPAGADALLEIDLARLRDNARIGPLVRALADAGELDIGFDIVRDADVVIVASYDVGGAAPTRVTIVRGAKAAAIPGAVALGAETVALATPALAARIEAVRQGREAALSDSRELLRARALAMPAKASGAAVRTSAVFDFDTRIALSRELDIDPVPRQFSVWGDVADDLAVIAIAEGDDAHQGKLLAAAVGRARDRIADSAPLRQLVVGYLVRGAEVEVKGATVRLVLVVGPTRLEKIVARILRRLGASS